MPWMEEVVLMIETSTVLVDCGRLRFGAEDILADVKLYSLYSLDKYQYAQSYDALLHRNLTQHSHATRMEIKIILAGIYSSSSQRCTLGIYWGSKWGSAVSSSFKPEHGSSSVGGTKQTGGV